MPANALPRPLALCSANANPAACAVMGIIKMIITLNKFFMFLFACIKKIGDVVCGGKSSLPST